jgi:elongation factor 1-beta
MSKYCITDETHLTTLDNHLKDNLYIGGNFPNFEDACVWEQYQNAKTEPCQEKHLNLWSWYSLVVLYPSKVKETWKAVKPVEKKPAEQKPKPAKKEEKTEEKTEEPKKTEKKADDDLDLFGDDNEEDAKAMAELQKKKDEEKKNLPKKTLIAKSLIILDIKVWDPEQDYDALAKKVLTIERDGLFWKTEYQLHDVAYGVKKIVIGLVIEDDKVSVDDIVEEIQGWEEEVQSVDIAAFNKI